MKESCIPHPANARFNITRPEYVLICRNDRCAACLLSFFEYWHNIKLEHAKKAARANDIAEMHGDARTQDESLWQFHTIKEMELGIAYMFTQKPISKALSLLCDLGFIVRGRNPNPRYKFDRTTWIMLKPEAVTAALEKVYPKMENSAMHDGNTPHREAYTPHGEAYLLDTDVAQSPCKCTENEALTNDEKIENPDKITYKITTETTLPEREREAETAPSAPEPVIALPDARSYWNRTMPEQTEIPKGPSDEEIKRWAEDVRKNGADYTDDEIKSARIRCRLDQWLWRGRPCADWRLMLEDRIQVMRNTFGKFGGSKPSNGSNGNGKEKPMSPYLMYKLRDELREKLDEVYEQLKCVQDEDRRRPLLEQKEKLRKRIESLEAKLEAAAVGGSDESDG